jgi:gliding motility-associated-like protein
MVVLKNTIFLYLLCLSSTIYSQYIQVNDTYTPQQLVEDLADSPCAGVSNFTANGDPFSSGAQSFGYFTNSSPNFPFANGIVLSTARASRSEGPNDNLIDEGSTSWPGDADLEQALGLNSTFNATSLEFDFTPLTSQVSFEYLFASEEYYGTSTCIYSDGFAFLLKPANSSEPYQNLAVIPNTSTPVLVTNVHPQIPNGCEAQNEQYFGSFNGNEHPINYNGQTAVLTAMANVIPGTTYHIKLVIADDHNYRYDSAIFLNGGSFSVGTDIGPDRLFSTNNPLCEGETYLLDATEPGTNTYQWFKNGSLLSGETNATYNVSIAGTYSVEVNIGGNGCIASGSATIEYSAAPVLNTQTLVQCDDDNDGVTTFNLTSLDSLITSNVPTGSVAYYENLVNAQNQASPIANPQAYLGHANTHVFARAENTYGCPGYATVNLQISNGTTLSATTIASCDELGAQDGITTFVLSTDVTPQFLAGLPLGLTAQYYASENEAVLQQNILPDNFTNTVVNQQVIFGRIVNGPDCFGIIPITLSVNTIASFEDEAVFICDTTPVILEVANSFVQYLWSNGEIDYQITITQPGMYTVTVTDNNGCTATKTFNVSASGVGEITSVELSDFSGDGNSVLVNFIGSGNYLFSLDGVNFQDSPLFTNVAPGEYTVFLKDMNGCGISPPRPIAVLDYPKFFTPNGDGYNDFWKIENLDAYPNSQVSIFDRFGKLLYSFRTGENGWDGKINGTDLPSTDYWFTITFENRTTVKSHFSLKR